MLKNNDNYQNNQNNSMLEVQADANIDKNHEQEPISTNLVPLSWFHNGNPRRRTIQMNFSTSKVLELKFSCQEKKI